MSDVGWLVRLLPYIFYWPLLTPTQDAGPRANNACFASTAARRVYSIASSRPPRPLMVLALPTRSFLCFIHVTPTCQHVPVVPASHVLSASPSLHRSHALSAVPERDTTLPSWRRGHDISAPAHLVHRSWISVLATHVTLQMSTQVSPVSREAGGSHFIARPHPAPWRTRRITAGSAAVSHYLAAVDVRLTYQ